MSLDEEFKILDAKINRLKLAYERYFLGTRPREPIVDRSDVEKQMTVFANTPIKNTALKFRFSSINSRYQAYKRQWNETLRKMEQGTYSRHRFKADLHDHEVPPPPAGSDAAGKAADSNELYQAYIQARKACGQSGAGISAGKLQATLEKQAGALHQ
ncbi:MAG: MXAN_5187 C-terminal domain-containing protein, partial [Myxococcota bacterium]